MKLKLLYTLSLLLCLSTLASSNECIRHCPSTTGPASAGPSASSLTTGQDKSATVTAEEEDEPAADRLALPLIKLLYI